MTSPLESPVSVHCLAGLDTERQNGAGSKRPFSTPAEIGCHETLCLWTWRPAWNFFFDQKKYHSFDAKAADDQGRNPFRQPQYLLINLALGGSWGGKLDDSVLPQKYLIDYVRVYQQDTDQR